MSWGQWLYVGFEVGVGSTATPAAPVVWGTGRWGQGRWSGLEPSWVDMHCWVKGATISRGRQRWTERIGASTASLEVDNSTGWATWNSDEVGATDLRPGSPLRLYAVTLADGVRYNLWRGFVETINDSYEPYVNPTAQLVAQDALAQVAHVDLPEQPPVGAGERSDQRIGRVLDTAGWPQPWRNLATGQVTMQATNLARNLADELGITADSEGGVVYAHTNGNVTFQNRDWLRLAPYATTVQYEIGPGGQVCGSKHDAVRDGGDVRNDVSLARAGGTAQRYVDQDSVSRYWRRTYNRSDLICETDAQVQLLAQRVLTSRSKGQLRLVDVVVPVVDAASAKFAATVDYGWRLEVTWDSPDRRETWTRQVHVMGITHRVSVESWETTLAVDDVIASPTEAWGIGRWGSAHWTEAN